MIEFFLGGMVMRKKYTFNLTKKVLGRFFGYFPQNDIKDGQGLVTRFTTAFTLAEVLITLGIIGVVAAITIPGLTSNYRKKQLETQIKATYTTIQQAMRLAEEEGGVDVDIIANNTASMKNWFQNFLQPALKTEQVCYQTAGCWHKKGEVKTLNHGNPSFETAVGINDSTLGWATMTFRIAKGAAFNLDGSGNGNTRGLFGVDSKGNSLQFYFDANGSAKPNVIGKDIYIMVYAPDVGFVPAGHSRTRQQVEQNCSAGNGYWCLERLKNDGWIINDAVWKR